MRETDRQTEAEKRLRDIQTDKQASREREKQRKDKQTDGDFPNYLRTAQPPMSTEGEIKFMKGIRSKTLVEDASP